MEKQILPSVCTMDCPDTCSLDVEVQDGRITAIRGSHTNPFTAGFICSKIGNFMKRVYSPDRLLHPMKRVGPKGSAQFKEISWDEACETIRSRFEQIRKEYGAEAILPFYYGGSNGILGQETVDRVFFAKLGASQLATTVCAAPTSAACQGMYGKMPGVAFEDYPHAKLIIIWGANPKASNIHLNPWLKKAKAAGAFIAVVDPFLNFSNREHDLHLPVLPGTDLVVALSMIRYWHQNHLLDEAFLNQHAIRTDLLLKKAAEYDFTKASEIAGVPATDIERLAQLYAEMEPAVIRIGWGLERNRNGGQAAAAILALPALMGKFGVPGGGYTLSNSSVAKIATNKLVSIPPMDTRQINMNLLGHVLLHEQNPPVKALFVYNCNPAATVPNQNAVLKGLEREDLFTVVFEQIMTDTARYADILLPAVTFLEQQELKKSYGSYVLQYLAPVIPACGEAKPNEEVFAMLGRAMGWNDVAFHSTTDDLLRKAAEAIRAPGGPFTIEQFKEKRAVGMDFPGPTPIQFGTTFPWTQDGKINLAPSALGEEPYRFIPNSNHYPLMLVSSSNNKMISSTMGEYNYPELFATMNPGDAASRALNDGMTVRVYNDLGEVHCKLKVRDSVRQGVVAIPKGAWRKSSRNGQTATALAPDTLGTAGGACFNDARVEVTAL
jgi:anaerobic selenocysteine-containing dehydrogenase